MYKVYVQTDAQGRIAAINSDAFLTYPIENWTQIDEGDGDKFHHAQGNYLPKSLITDDGVYRYKLIKDKVTERTAAEIATDVALLPKAPPSIEERVATVEEAVTLIAEVLI